MEEALNLVQDATIREGFGVLHVHNVTEALKKKGFELFPAYIVEVCQPQIAHQLITIDPLILLFLPCRIAVFSEAGQTVVSAQLTAPMEHYIPGLNYSEVSPIICAALQKIVDAAL